MIVSDGNSNGFDGFPCGKMKCATGWRVICNGIGGTITGRVVNRGCSFGISATHNGKCHRTVSLVDGDIINVQGNIIDYQFTVRAVACRITGTICHCCRHAVRPSAQRITFRDRQAPIATAQCEVPVA